METEYRVVIHVTCSSCIHISYEYSFCLPMFKNVRVLGLNEDFGHACAVHSQGITIHCPIIVSLVEICSQFVKHVGIRIVQNLLYKDKDWGWTSPAWEWLQDGGESWLSEKWTCVGAACFSKNNYLPHPESNVLEGDKGVSGPKCEKCGWPKTDNCVCL